MDGGEGRAGNGRGAAARAGRRAGQSAVVHPGAVRENIRAIIAMEEQQARARGLGDRLSDAIAGFAGTVLFVAVHLVGFAVWAAVNLQLIPGVPAFDPYPFALLCMILSMEGVLLSTFVLIKQNRMGRRSDRRNHLDLQINLLTEKEVTKTIQLLRAVAARLGVEDEDEEVAELAHETAVGDLAEELTRSIPEDV